MNDIYEIIAGIIAVVVVFGLLIGGAFLLDSCSKGTDIEAWNCGYHEYCGGRWKYEQAVGHRYSTNYIYVCDKCGMRHEFYNYFKEVTDEDSVCSKEMP